MSLDDEEDNDLYGSGKKARGARKPCENCGVMAHFGNATGDREKLGWCGDCFAQREKESFVNQKGERVYKNRTIVRRTPFDSRGNP